jgi:hypothetical protein
VLTLSEPTYQAVKRALQRTTQHNDLNAATQSLQQRGPDIRDIAEYQAFFDHHADGTQPIVE